VQLSNPRQERARNALSLEQLTKSQRATIAVHLRRFMTALREQKAFDEKVAASLVRIARNPAFRKRLLALNSQFKQRIFEQ
jgi:hypothetical protein